MARPIVWSGPAADDLAAVVEFVAKRQGKRSLGFLAGQLPREVNAVAAQYVYMWEFIVSADRASAFERTYGSSGEWVQLFRRAPGYLRTELHRDRSQPQRFLTIDYWESKEAWEAFRTRFAEEFDALDAKCMAWTTSEAEIGRFEPVP